MRLEYNEEQEKQLRIIEIESILENDLYDSEIDKLALEIELQFLQGNKDGYEAPRAFVDIASGESLEVTYQQESSQFSVLIHDVNGVPVLPYYNADTIEELLMEVLEC